MELPSSIQEERVRRTLEIQFPGIDINALWQDLAVTVSKKTGRVRGIYDKKTSDLLFSLRTSDGRFVPSFEGGTRMIASGYSNNRVVMNADAAPYIAKGKSAFCKHVIDADENVVPFGEVLLIDEDDNLLAVGTANQPAYAMKVLSSGIAARVKHSRD